MKHCPQCERTYADDTISFCLADGQLLSASYGDAAATLPLTPRTTDAAQTLILPAALSSEKARRIIRRNWIIGAAAVPIGVVISMIQFSNVPGNENQPAAALIAAAVIGGVVWGYFAWSACWGYPKVWRWWRSFGSRVLNLLKQSVHFNTIITVLVVLLGLCLFAPMLALVTLYFYSLFVVGLVYSIFGGGIFQFLQARKIARHEPVSES